VFNDATLTTGKKEQRDEEERNLDACYECQKEDGGEFNFRSLLEM